jgi:hypothetical protein
MAFTVSQRFEIERWNRIIDNTTSVEDLRRAAKELFHAWQSQKAATAWAMRNALSSAPSYTDLVPSQSSLEDIHQEDVQRQHDSDQPPGEEDPAGQRPGLEAQSRPQDP